MHKDILKIVLIGDGGVGKVLFHAEPCSCQYSLTQVFC